MFSALLVCLALGQIQPYGLYQDSAGYSLNNRGQQEKYLRGKISSQNYKIVGDPYYFLLPTGDLYEFTPPYNNPALVGVKVAATKAYDDPSTILTTQTLWVANTGSDTNPGTDSTKPLATLPRAAILVKAGYTVRVAPGNYQAFISGWDAPHPNLLGTKELPISFIGGPGVVISLRNNKSHSGINLINCSYVTLDGFRIPSDTDRGLSIESSPNITVQNCVVTGGKQFCIYATHCDYFTVQDSEASGAQVQHGIYVANGCTNPSILRNRLLNNRSSGLHLNGDDSQSFDSNHKRLPGPAGTGLVMRATISGNFVSGNGPNRNGAGINCDGVQSSIISDNMIVGNHARGLTLFRSDAAGSAINNIVTGNVIVQATGASYALGVKNASVGNTFKNNVFKHPDPNGIAVVFQPDSLAGTLFTDAAPSRYSLDDGNTVVDLAGLLKAIIPAPPAPPAPSVLVPNSLKK